MDIFDGDIVPDNFEDQPVNHYLFQLYRRWNCSLMLPSKVSNGAGGTPAQYAEKCIDGWSFGPLDKAVEITQTWFLDHSSAAQKCLDKMLALQASPTVTTFILALIPKIWALLVHAIGA